MKNFQDKEYHPVVEDYIAHYSEDTLDGAEDKAFAEVLVYDDDLRELAHSAKLGRALLQEIAVKIKADKNFEQRLAKRISQSN